MTAYERRISDWSSDVCSSDLLAQLVRGGLLAPLHLVATHAQHRLRGQAQVRADRDLALDQEADDFQLVVGTFELDHARAGLQQARGRVERAPGRRVGLDRRTEESRAGEECVEP